MDELGRKSRLSWIIKIREEAWDMKTDKEKQRNWIRAVVSASTVCFMHVYKHHTLSLVIGGTTRTFEKRTTTMS